jgi:hypothetical protein
MTQFVKVGRIVKDRRALRIEIDGREACGELPVYPGPRDRRRPPRLRHRDHPPAGRGGPSSSPGDTPRTCPELRAPTRDRASTARRLPMNRWTPPRHRRDRRACRRHRGPDGMTQASGSPRSGAALEIRISSPSICMVTLSPSTNGNAESPATSAGMLTNRVRAGPCARILPSPFLPIQSILQGNVFILIRCSM